MSLLASPSEDRLLSGVDLFRTGRMPMANSLSSRATSAVAAVLLGTAVVVSGTAAALAGYAATHGDPFAGGPVAPWALPIRPGLETDGTRLTQVVPGGPGWTAGLRPGWAVESGEAGLPGAVFACDGPTKCVFYHDLQPQSALAWRWWIESLAAILVIIGLLTWRRRPRLAGLLAMAAIAFSAPTYALLGQVPLFPALYALSVVGPPLWLRLTGTNRLWTILLIGALVAGAIWVIAWLALPEIYDAAEVARQLATVVAVAAGIVVLSGLVALDDVSIARDRIVDAVVVIAVIGWAAATWLGSPSDPDWAAAGVAGIAVVAYLALRHRLRSLLARVTSAEVGQRATIQALEAERSRVARDLHDVPLQELTAIIHRLDRQPTAASETARLREIAGHLRDVSVSLRPPVLDDVGLGAALAELADRHQDDGGVPIRISLDDQTHIDPASRPPADVELAVYRIVQEALTNAQRHARASGIVVDGTIGRDRLRVTITDDGLGVDRQSVALAERAGRLGLASMRERAAAIGAVLRISLAPGRSGTSVSVEWSAR